MTQSSHCVCLLSICCEHLKLFKKHENSFPREQSFVHKHLAQMEIKQSAARSEMVFMQTSLWFIFKSLILLRHVYESLALSNLNCWWFQKVQHAEKHQLFSDNPWPLTHTEASDRPFDFLLASVMKPRILWIMACYSWWRHRFIIQHAGRVRPCRGQGSGGGRGENGISDRVMVWMENEERQFPRTSKFFFQRVEGELSLNTRDIFDKEQSAEAFSLHI